MTFLAIRYAALALGLVALSACSSLRGTASSYASQRQPLDSFIKSRPEAAALLSKYSALDQWLRRELCRPLGPYRLAWDDGPPGGGAMGSHSYSPEHQFVIVRIERDLPPADQLAGLVYEICNSRGYLRIGELVKQAERRTIAREAFVDGLLNVEVSALRRTGQLLPQVMPLSPSERKPLLLYNAFLDAPADFSQFAAWQRRHTRGRGGYDVRAFYGKQYDQLVTNDRTAAPNKTDAGNGSKAICRVSNVLRSPSPDPKRSAFPSRPL